MATRQDDDLKRELMANGLYPQTHISYRIRRSDGTTEDGSVGAFIKSDQITLAEAIPPLGEGDILELPAIPMSSADGYAREKRPVVQGNCPMGCGQRLVLGNGGKVMCDNPECPNRSAAGDSLDDGNLATTEHLAILLRANQIYERRTSQYKNTWQSYGWRGCLVHLRTCVERAWHQWWNAPVLTQPKVDNLLDAINYAVFTVRNIEANNRNGTWEYDAEQ